MSSTTSIEWTDATWNPVRGCSRVSPGCGGANHQGGCYAEKIAARFSGPGQPFHGLAERTPHGGRWTGVLAAAPNDVLLQPLYWKKPRRIFVNSMSDLFHEALPDETIDRVFAVMALCPQHTFQILTKRPERMLAWFEERWQATPAQRLDLGKAGIIDIPAGGETGRFHQVEQACDSIFEMVPKMTDTDNDALWDANGRLKCRQFAWPLPNVWLGVSTEDQATADARIPYLLGTPATRRFISAEPLLGPIDLLPYLFIVTHADEDQLATEDDTPLPWNDPKTTPAENIATPRLDWVIAGGESGGKLSRPMHPGWVRGLRDQCALAEVPFFFKQWGDYLPLGPPERWQAAQPTEPSWQYVGKKAAGAELDGRLHREFPT